MPSGITAPAEVIAWNLRAYGEPEVADAVAVATEDMLFRVWTEAFKVMTTTPEPRLVDYYLARAAVRIVTGQDRPLRRHKRRFTEPEPKVQISPDTYARWWDRQNG